MATNNSRGNAGYRLYLLGGILLFWCCAICLRLVYLQVFCYREFEQRALRQQQRTMEVSPKRGIIFDRAGHELAMSVSVDSVLAVPTEVPDRSTPAIRRARVVRADPRDLPCRCET